MNIMGIENRNFYILHNVCDKFIYLFNQSIYLFFLYSFQSFVNLFIFGGGGGGGGKVTNANGG